MKGSFVDAGTVLVRVGLLHRTNFFGVDSCCSRDYLHLHLHRHHDDHYFDCLPLPCLFMVLQVPVCPLYTLKHNIANVPSHAFAIF